MEDEKRIDLSFIDSVDMRHPPSRPAPRLSGSTSCFIFARLWKFLSGRMKRTVIDAFIGNLVYSFHITFSTVTLTN